MAVRRTHFAATLASLLAASLALAACGGGGDSTTTTTPPSTAASSQAVQTSAANTASVPQAATEASSSMVETTEAVVQTSASSTQVNGATATVSVNCAGGGTAVYTVTAPTAAQATNGILETGEHYQLTFTNCTGAAGLRTVNGSLTLDVVSATPTQLSIQTATSDVVVTLPRGDVTLNGHSTFDRTITTSGATTTTASEWQTPSYTVTTTFNARNSTYSFTNIDLKRTVVTTNGTVTSTACSGTGTFSATLPNGSFSVTESTQGDVMFDANGVPVSGTWTLVLPHNTIMISIASGVATVSVDYGSDGTIDKVYTFQVTDLEASAG